MNSYDRPPPPYASAPNAPPGYGPPASQNPAQPGFYGASPAAAPPSPPAGGFGAPPPGPAPAPQGYGGYGVAPPAPGYGVAPGGYAPPPPFAGGYQAGAYGYSAAPEPPVTNGAPTLRWFVLGSFLGLIVLTMIGGGIGAAMEGDETGQAIAGVFSFIGMMMGVAYFVTALTWLYKSWEMLPHAFRFTQAGTRVTPGGAIGFLFVPFYNYYWIFKVSAGLSAAYDRVLAAHGSPKRAGRGLGVAASILQVIPYLNLALGPFLWIPWMLTVESAKREYARIAGQPRGF